MWIYVNQTCQEVSQVLRTLELHFSCLTPGDKASSSSSEVSADVPDGLLDAFFSRQRWSKKNIRIFQGTTSPQFNSGFLRNSQRIKSFGHIFCSPNSHFPWQFGFTFEGLIHLFGILGTWIQQPLVAHWFSKVLGDIPRGQLKDDMIFYSKKLWYLGSFDISFEKTVISRLISNLSDHKEET